MDEKAKEWMNSPGARAGIKVGILAAMVLALLIPIFMIRGLVSEREQRSEEAQWGIIEQNGGSQSIAAPRLVVPYSFMDEAGDVQRRTIVVIPDQVSVDAVLEPRVLTRGIYEAPIYETDVVMTGVLTVPDRLATAESSDPLFAWDRAEFVIPLESVRGIRTAAEVTLNGEPIDVQSASIAQVGVSGITTHVGEDESLRSTIEGRQPIEFSVRLALSGGGTFTVSPLAQTAAYSLSSSWSDPSFSGSFLPSSRDISGEGFSAEWSATSIGMGVPTLWTSIPGSSNYYSAEMRVELYQPVSAYQLSERSVKYGPLFVILPFVALFLLETFAGLRIHPVQYLMVAAAKIVFYLLLLSLSEQIDFRLAFWIGAITTVLLLTIYVRAVAGTAGRAGAMCGMLTAEYLFLYAALQSQDYALLIGSIGLFVVLAAVMIATRSINWYSPRSEESAQGRA